MKTLIEKFNDATDEEQKVLTRILTNEDFEVHGRELASIRRRNFAESLATSGNREVEIYQLIKEREDNFLEEFSDLNLPDWFLRIEAQDVLMKIIYQKFEEEKLL